MLRLRMMVESTSFDEHDSAVVKRSDTAQRLSLRLGYRPVS